MKKEYMRGIKMMYMHPKFKMEEIQKIIKHVTEELDDIAMLISDISKSDKKNEGRYFDWGGFNWAFQALQADLDAIGITFNYYVKEFEKYSEFEGKQCQQ